MTEASYSITEVANMLELPQHVLRMWESQFSSIQPVRSRNGRRAYTTETIDSIRTVQKLLHDEGLTMAEARKRLEGGTFSTPVQALPVQNATQGEIVPEHTGALRAVLEALETASAALARR